MAFWTIESLEMTNTLTYGGARRPSIRSRSTVHVPQVLFTFVVPARCVNFFPSLAILGRAGPRLTLLARPGSRRRHSWP